MRRLLPLLLVLLASLALGACGDDPVEEAGVGQPVPGATEPPEFEEAGAPYALDEIEDALERAGLNVNRIQVGNRESTGLISEIEADVLSSARFQEGRTSQKFDILIFPSRQVAKDAVSQLRDTTVVEEGGAVVVGQNVAAVAEEPFEGPVLGRVRAVVQGLPAQPARGEEGTATQRDGGGEEPSLGGGSTQ